MTERNLPPIMHNAREDLLTTIDGRFSPENWEHILRRAADQWHALRAREPQPGEVEAWQEVVRDFHRTQYWGYPANFRPAPAKRKKNLGLQFIWFTVSALTFMKIAVLWFGQIYARSEDASDKWIFFAVLALVVGNFAYFLWRNHAHPD